MLIRLRRLNATTILCLLLAVSLKAEDTHERNSPDHRIVLRLSDTFLNSVMDDNDIHREADVHEVILGTSVHGAARIVGQPGVKFIESSDDASFNITLEGTVDSRTVGYNGPAIIRSHSVTKYTASRKVVFKPGEGFYALPSKVSAHTDTVVEDISSSRDGLAGRMIRRRARSIEAERHAEATEITRQKTERRIEEAFDRSTERRLARLNRIVEYRLIAAAAFRSAGQFEPKYACCTTPHYLQIATRFGESGSAIELPANETAGGAPIEIWIHESIYDSISERMTLFTRPRFPQWTSHFPLVVQSLFGDRVNSHKVDDWRVVQLQMPDTEHVRATATRATGLR